MAAVGWLRGIFPPVVTPFDQDGEFDEEAYRRELRALMNAGVHGVATTGTTAEGSSLSEDEYRRVFEIAAEETRGRVPFLAGIIPDSTRQAVRLAKRAAEAGATGLMVTPVHYLVPKLDGLVDYYKAIADASGLPIVIYNVVPRVSLTAEDILRLAEIPQIVGVKQSAGDIRKLAQILHVAGDRLAVMSGLDDLILPSLVLGARGTICAVNSILPDLSVQLYEAVQRGRMEEAVALHNRILPVVVAAIYDSTNFPAGVKAAINLRGRSAGFPRSPILPANSAETEAIRRALIKAGVLGEEL